MTGPVRPAQRAAPRRLTCPRCRAIVSVPFGQAPRCKACGYPDADPAAAPAASARPAQAPGRTAPPGTTGAASADRPRTRAAATGLAIEARGLTKRYPRTVAVDTLDFQVPRGTIVGFVGPNGAGKTTTIRMLLALIRPTAGTATILGHPVHHPRAFLPRVGALIEAPAFYPQLSGRRNLEVLAILGGTDRARVGTVLQEVGLAERAGEPYKSYSLGMKQRLGIAAALLPDPDLLVLDEPTNGLDPAGIREIRALLQRLAKEGRTVFVSSHLLAEVERMCDAVVILRRGRLVYSGPVQGLLAARSTLRAVAEDRTHHARLAALAQAAGFQARASPDSVDIQAPAAFAAELNRRAMRQGITLVQLATQGADLEETVLGLTGTGAP